MICIEKNWWGFGGFFIVFGTKSRKKIGNGTGIPNPGLTERVSGISLIARLFWFETELLVVESGLKLLVGDI